MSKAVIVIPARYGSSRLPGKPLLDIVGKPMIQHVYERALQVAGVAEVWVATDDPRVEQAVQAFDGKAIMTRTDLRLSSRCAAKLQPATGVHAGAGGITGAATVNERGNQHSHV